MSEKPYRLEQRVKPEVWARSEWLHGLESKTWKRSWRKYRRRRDRRQALKTLNRKSRIWEYRIPPKEPAP